MYQKSINLLPNQLTQDTRYRFTELELSKALKILSTLTSQHHAITILINHLAPFHPQHHEELKNALESYSFEAKHNEVIQYLRYKNLGIQKIRKIVKESTNNLIKGGRYDEVPDFQPVFKHWHELPDTWQHLKHHFNLFHEDLVHMIEPKEKPITPKDPQTEVYPIIPTTEAEAERAPTFEELFDLDEDNPYVKANKQLNEWSNF